MIDIPTINNLVEIHNSNSTIVFEGFDQTANKPVAVKMLKDEFPTLKSIAKFNEEFEITQRLNIQGIRKAYAKQKIQNKHILLLDYIEGESLRKAIDQGRIPLADFLPLAIKISSVLSEMHMQGVIHKDINPRNIIVLPSNDIKIIDFGISTLIKRQTQQLESPDALEGTLAYISPEQTGRMNRSVDYRTDLYSLGVTFYEMLTGELPFIAEDSMEFIHAHMAKQPMPAIHKNSNIPLIVSEIINKLLAKNAEERYQSAEGLKYDLKLCLESLEKEGKVLHFEIGNKDWANTFQIPEKLYGRSNESQMLLDTFFKAASGSQELMLVAGYSGIGKTALVNEVHKPVTEKKGYFISGKFDQFQRDIPFSAIIQALKDFVSQLLTEPEKNISRWRKIISASLRTNGKVITDVIPSLELIIGVQPDIPELGPSETQNRFNLIFQEFIRGISQEEHPLVMFIDDWQWADMASLNLLKLLMTNHDNQYFMMIGAYRDNEVDATHPFARAIEDLKKEEVAYQQIDLKPLSLAHTNHLVSDTLNNDPSETQKLSEAIYEKTQGNPFFTNQFFETLYDEELLTFNKTDHKWEWNITEIKEKQFTDNVIELMVSKIQKLKPSTQKELKKAACIGNEFNLRTLSHIDNRNQKEVLNDLWEAVEEGMILPLSKNYQAIDENVAEDAKVYFKFLHDRVHQATYSLIDDQVRQYTNLEIGRLTYQNNTQEYINEWICDIANYYNNGASLITEKSEKAKLVELNLQAGIKAKRSTAYEAALKYFKAGIELLEENPWEHQYKLTFDIYKNYAECAFLSIQYELAEELFSIIINKAKTRVEKIEIYTMKIVYFESIAKYAESVATAKEALAELDLILPDSEEEKLELFQKEVANIMAKLEEIGGVEQIPNLPRNTNPEVEEKIKILTIAYTPAYMLGDMNLTLVVSALTVSASLQYGNGYFSPWGYASFATFLSAGLVQFDTAQKMGEAALTLTEKLGNISLLGGIHHLMGCFTNPYVNNLKDNFKYFDKAYEYSIQTGNFPFASYAYGVKARHLFMNGTKLDELAEQCNVFVQRLTKIKSLSIVDILTVVKKCGDCLAGKTEADYSFTGDDFNEEAYLKTYEGFPIFFAVYYPLKARMYLMLDKPEEALKCVEQSENYMVALLGMIWNILHNVNHSLTLLALIKQGADNTDGYLGKVKENQEKLLLWANSCPENYMHQYVLIEAELANIEGRYLDAMDLFDKAITLSQNNEFVQYEALANELAAKFYQNIDKQKIANLYYKHAHYAYGLWGASAKVKQLESKHPQLLEKSNFSATTSSTTHTVSSLHTQSSTTSTSSSGSLDFSTLLKASQAIASEMKLETLLNKLLKIIAENAGADKVYLVLQEKSEYLIQASYSIQDNKAQVLQAISLEETEDLPTSFINYALRMKQDLILNNASKENQFKKNAYVVKNSPKSVLAGLIWQKGDVKAVLYLENSQTSGVFTPQRVELLSMLSSQIITSIDNAYLYHNTEQLVEERTLELLDKNKRLTDSILYAETIQGAILPTEEELNANFSKHFVIYRPKDIVSGDFYWLNEVKGSAVLACIDCTGHGVPGAFMSMIGNTLLDEIVIQKENTDPAQILELLHQNIRKALKQDKEKGGNTDGMDMSICVFTKLGDGKHKLEFAGAKRPLWLIKDNALDVIPGDRKSIGGFQKESKRKFTTKTFELSSGDIVYQFTDGFVDQNNPDMKRFGTKRLRELIASYANVPIDKQFELLTSNLDVFKAGEAQRDDITIVAVEM